MITRLVLATSLVILFLIAGCIQSYSQETQHDSAAACADEISMDVAALDNFHTVIAQVWHTAWPEKDLAMLVDLLPEIERLSDSLMNAKLPGILRDKEKPWKENIEKLRLNVKEYKGATSPLDSVKLLDAAERLHGQFERLARSIRPVLPEIDAFHQVLYMLYHHYLPDKDEKNIASSIAELKVRMTALDSAKLPERLAKKADAFHKARKLLSQRLDECVQALNKNPKTGIAEHVETMHSAYQSVEKVFE